MSITRAALSACKGKFPSLFIDGPAARRTPAQVAALAQLPQEIAAYPAVQRQLQADAAALAQTLAVDLPRLHPELQQAAAAYARALARMPRRRYPSIDLFVTDLLDKLLQELRRTPASDAAATPCPEPPKLPGACPATPGASAAIGFATAADASNTSGASNAFAVADVSNTSGASDAFAAADASNTSGASDAFAAADVSNTSGASDVFVAVAVAAAAAASAATAGAPAAAGSAASAAAEDAATVADSDAELRHQAQSMVDLGFADLARCNATAKLDGREIWPLAAGEGWRAQADAWLPLMVENRWATGSAKSYCFADLQPEDPDAPQALPRVFPRRLWHWTKVAKQPVRPLAVQEAMRALEVAKQYCDTRQQRIVAWGVDALQQLPAHSPAVEAAHVQAVRAAALQQVADAAARAPASPGLQRHLAARRRALTDLRQVPLFARLPWRLSVAEAAAEAARFSTFARLPRGQGPRRGNCNSIAFALLQAAARLDAPAGAASKPPRLPRCRWLRALGATHRLRLPQGGPC